jgi:hypothetical protein
VYKKLKGKEKSRNKKENEGQLSKLLRASPMVCN